MRLPRNNSTLAIRSLMIRWALVPALLLSILVTVSTAQNDLLQSGPMLGYSDYREVMLWAQTKAEAKVHFLYWDRANPSLKHHTADFVTRRSDAFVAKVVADRVEPGRKYGYDLYINDTPVKRPYPTEFQTLPLWQYRADPPEFTVALGSCLYVNEPQYDRPGTPYGSDYGIVSALHAKRPDAMLWLGDYMYLREVDWNTRTGILNRWTHTRSLPELQPLLASTHHYIIWDDHEYGPNDSDRSFWNRDTSLDAFKLFSGNPNYGVKDLGGITSRFEWGDVEFFLLDNRWFRAPNRRKNGDRDYLGKRQIEWLIDALAYSRAPFKIVAVGGQVLNTAAAFENYANYDQERQELFKEIADNDIPGVLFVTGDRHYSELSKMPREGRYPLYDLTVSSLTAGSNTRALEEHNALRIPETVVMKHNFAILKFSGPRRERVMTITVYDKDGAELWTCAITAKEIS